MQTLQQQRRPDALTARRLIDAGRPKKVLKCGVITGKAKQFIAAVRQHNRRRMNRKSDISLAYPIVVEALANPAGHQPLLRRHPPSYRDAPFALTGDGWLKRRQII